MAEVVQTDSYPQETLVEARAESSESSSTSPRNLLARWWTQPAGGREVLTLAWPLMLSTGLLSVNMFVDRMMLYWHSDNSASSAMLAGTLFWALTCAPSGLLSYTSTFVAQYWGAGRLDRAFQVVGQGMLLAAVICPLFLSIALLGPYLFRSVGHVESLVTSETAYLFWLIPSAFAMFFAAPLSGLFSGVGKVRVLLACDAVSVALNILFSAILIFGLFGAPRLGVTGAAIGTSIAMIAKCLLLVWAAHQYHRESIAIDARTGRAQAKHRVEHGKWFDFPLMVRLLQFGWPAGIQLLAESISFTIIMLLVGRLGEQSMSATTLALGVNILAFIPMTGLGLAIGILVGQRLTSGNIELAQRSVRTGQWIAFVYSMFFVILYGGLSDWVLSVYSIGTDPERFEAMRPLLKPLLVYIAIYCVFDAFQIVYVGAIKGAGDTAFVLFASVLIGLVVVGGGTWLSFFVDGDLFYWWRVISVWVFAMAAVFAGRYFQGKWKSMRVIESNLNPSIDND